VSVRGEEGARGKCGDLRLVFVVTGVAGMLLGELECQEWRDMFTGVTLAVGEVGDCDAGGGEDTGDTRGPGRGVKGFG